MGVPGFFAWILRKYKKNKIIIDNNNDIETDFILFDTNCLLHPTCFKVLAMKQEMLNKSKHVDIKKLENTMMKECLNYIDSIVSYIKPKVGVYIAIDGVAPVAKIKQQRSRRFKSVSDRQLKENILKKHKKPTEYFWNNSAITPGTDFMIRLHKMIINWIKNKKDGLKYIYSSCYEPAEGEHKLLEFIRKNRKYRYIIYGLDADLIFLSLASNHNKIYLLREAVHLKNDNDKFVFVDIDMLKVAIMETMHNYMIKDEDSNIMIELKNDIINDFIFICYFLGNDFLPHMEALDISKGGIDILLKCYCNMYKELYLNGKKPYIVLKNKICKKNLLKFIDLLYVDEKEILKLNYNTKRYYPKCDSNDSYVREMHRIDNVMFKVNDPIMVGKDNYNDYRKRYYMYHMNVEEKDLEKTVEDICMKYLQGLEWVTIYYFKGCPDWHWYYPYDYPPFLNDIKKYIKKYKLTKFNLNSPLKPYQQLLCVLPIQSKYLVPYKYRYYMHPKSKLGHLYPYRFKQDFIGKTKYWKGIPILPKLDIESVLNI
jgi:5'-3' exonuclease